MLPLIGIPTANGLIFYAENLVLIGGYLFMAVVMAFGSNNNPILRSFVRWEPPIPAGVDFYRFRCTMRLLRINQIRIAAFFFCLFSVATHTAIGLHAAFGIPAIVNGMVPWYFHASYIPKGVCLWFLGTGIIRPRKYKDPETAKSEMEDTETLRKLAQLEQKQQLWRQDPQALEGSRPRRALDSPSS
jgi:hypothetical protein